MTESRTMRVTVHYTSMGEIRNAYNILTQKPQREDLHGRRRRRWDHNIKMDIRVKGNEGAE